jgi:hypothetical protein
VKTFIGVGGWGRGWGVKAEREFDAVRGVSGCYSGKGDGVGCQGVKGKGSWLGEGGCQGVKREMEMREGVRV